MRPRIFLKRHFLAFIFLLVAISVILWSETLFSNHIPSVPRTWRRRDATTDWKTPISFFGKVVDENNKPVSDANIEFICNDLSADGTTAYKTRSDGVGRFEIKRISGKYLAVHVQKSGYYSSKANPPGFMYAGDNVNFQPNPQEPVVFRLRRAGILPHLLERRGLIKVPPNGNAVTLDLVEKGSSVEPAWIVLKSESAQNNEGSGRYVWKLSITVPGGGIQHAGSEFNFLAPEDGYAESISIESEDPSSRKWQDGIDGREFFIRVDHNYARLWVAYVSYNGAFRYLSLVNLNGSQNLEGPLDGR